MFAVNCMLSNDNNANNINNSFSVQDELNAKEEQASTVVLMA